MSSVCSYCNALEGSGEAPDMCCSGGKVRLTPLNLPSAPLELLMSGATAKSPHFLENIRKYNCCFQVTSFGATNEVCEPGFMPTFQVQDQVYYRVGSLLPFPIEEHRFHQVYFIGDKQNKGNQRSRNIPRTSRPVKDWDCTVLETISSETFIASSPS